MHTPPGPPPQCPAHGGGPLRLYGQEAEADPMALYERARDTHGSIAPVLVLDDLPAWLVLGYRENLQVARNANLFSRDPRNWRALQEGKVRDDHPLSPMTTWWPVVNFNDGEVHKRLSDAVKDGLRRFERLGLHRYVARCSNQLIDDFANGRADLVADFAMQLPILVMGHLVGVHEEHGPKLVHAVPDMLQGTDTSLASDRYVTTVLQDLVKERKNAPAHDLTSWLLEHPSQLTDEEVLAHVRVTLVAACETTATLIANTLRMVLTDQRWRAHLSGGQMTLPEAVEQMLWDQPPLNTIIGRWATETTQLGGHTIQKGDMLLLGLAAGNQDPAVRPADDDLSAPIHTNRSHLAFSSGAHECPGQDIGRAIAQAGIDTLLARVTGLALSVPEEELRRSGTLMSQHLISLPVTFLPPEAKGTDPTTAGQWATQATAHVGTPRA
ncbi:cytochrome P450 [Streptomyces sp. NPDC048506]|uniref:cytochrome P450 n=1 Tax=Streptomyces sp. NPDC048506 TaxID=3155028 RepID=UPI003443412A